MLVNIYCLYDPIESKIRYIGRTRKDIQIRLIEHISKAKWYETYYPGKPAPYRVNWIKSLLNKGYAPKIKLLKIVNGWSESHIIERELINKYKDKYCLVNLEDRGEGGVNTVLSEITKITISNSLKEGFKNGKIKKTTKPLFIFNEYAELVTEVIGYNGAAQFLEVKENTIKKKLVSGRSINSYFISKTRELNTSNLHFIYSLETNKKEYFSEAANIYSKLGIYRSLFDKYNGTGTMVNGYLINSTEFNGITLFLNNESLSKGEKVSRLMKGKKKSQEHKDKLRQASLEQWDKIRSKKSN